MHSEMDANVHKSVVGMWMLICTESCSLSSLYENWNGLPALCKIFQYQITWLFLCYSVEIDQEIVILINTRGVQMHLKCGESLQKC